jgi:tRNA nucleotidyltransferase (CCA-adding enzyme)
VKIYLVGGAIRDQLLGLPVIEKDWVVVGSSPEALLAAGFQPVGKDFPVFLHPETHEEYALARTERKVGKGYKGFTFHTDRQVTLTEDLKRRDLTINAIAESSDGQLIDPYHGQADLQQKILRHISPAFSEDPVRILRLARFAAKLPEFTVDPDTNTLMQKMVTDGEVDALVAERVWQEFSKALTENQPLRFFEVLANCQALSILFPMINLCDDHILALNRANTITKKATIRFAVVMHAIELPQVKIFIQRYRCPKAFSELALLSCRYTQDYERLMTMDAENLLHFIKHTDALRRPERFNDFMIACQACTTTTHHQQRLDHINRAIAAIKSVDIPALAAQGLAGKAFANALHQAQIKKINQQESP